MLFPDFSRTHASFLPGKMSMFFSGLWRVALLGSNGDLVHRTCCLWGLLNE